MEANQFKRQVKAIIFSSFEKDVDSLINKAVNSGCIDVSEIKEDDYKIAKALTHAIFLKYASLWQPLSKEGLSESKNIQKFI